MKPLNKTFRIASKFSLLSNISNSKSVIITTLTSRGTLLGAKSSRAKEAMVAIAMLH